MAYKVSTLLICLTIICVFLALWPNERQWDPAALHFAAKDGDVDRVRTLLDRGYAVDLPDPGKWSTTFGEGKTPLHVATFYGHVEVAALLIERGANVNAENYAHATPLFDACNGRLTSLLLEHGALVEVRDAWQYGPLHRIARNSQDPKAVELMLEKGAEIDARAEIGNTPLHEAIVGAVPEVVEVLLRYGADPDAKTQTGRTPLHWATGPPLWSPAHDLKPVIRLLAKYGADVNAVDHNGLTPILSAKQFHDSEMVDVLRDLGARDVCE